MTQRDDMRVAVYVVGQRNTLHRNSVRWVAIGSGWYHTTGTSFKQLLFPLFELFKNKI